MGAKPTTNTARTARLAKLVEETLGVAQALIAEIEELDREVAPDPRLAGAPEEMERDRLLNQTEAAAYLGLQPKTLANKRHRGGGPTYIKLGSFAKYRRSDLDEWLAAKRRRSTSDQGDQAQEGMMASCHN